jgi:hypothetical protein
VSLDRVRDEFLARRAKAGDQVAFAELARRYRPLIAAATRTGSEDLEAEDARQAALIGLMEACRATDGTSRFAGIASVRVRWKVAVTRRAARARKQRILTDAVREGEQPDGPLARLRAPEGTDPARAVELRAELRERIRERASTARRRSSAPAGDLRRRYSDQQINRAVTMVADGSTIAAAAAAVGAGYGAVRGWLEHPRTLEHAERLARRRAQAPGGKLSRRFTDEQINHALAMMANGSTITSAAAAVGATHPTILRWLRKAA